MADVVVLSYRTQALALAHHPNGLALLVWHEFWLGTKFNPLFFWQRHVRRLKGVVRKKREAPYRSGSCRDWLKVKTADADASLSPTGSYLLQARSGQRANGIRPGPATDRCRWKWSNGDAM
jgi:hypothetical protein